MVISFEVLLLRIITIPDNTEKKALMGSSLVKSTVVGK